MNQIKEYVLWDLTTDPTVTTTYQKPLNLEVGGVSRYLDFNASGEIGVGNLYYDTAITLANGEFIKGKTYYLSFNIKRQDTPQTIKIRLKAPLTGGVVNPYEEDENFQNFLQIAIPQINVEGTQSTMYYPVEFAFTPRDNYSHMVLQLVRTSFDEIINLNNPEYYGREVIIDQTSLKGFEVLNLLETVLNVKEIKQLGVRTSPGVLMCINGEEILVGPTGTYEIYNGIPIKFLSFITGFEGKNKFPQDCDKVIIDYIYDDSSY